MKLFKITLFLAAATLAGCNSTKMNQEQNKTEDSLAIGAANSAKNTITEKYWKLITLEGQPVEMAPNQERETYFILKNDQSRMTGFAGCNNFDGTYTIENGWRIRFSPLAVTMKACPDVDVDESEFLKVFELADNCTMQGDTLSLNVGRKAPLAIFKAVYF